MRQTFERIARVPAHLEETGMDAVEWNNDADQQEAHHEEDPKRQRVVQVRANLKNALLQDGHLVRIASLIFVLLSSVGMMVAVQLLHCDVLDRGRASLLE